MKTIRGRGRPKGTQNVTDAERQRIPDLFAAGVRVAEIAKQVDRGESLIYRCTRDLDRDRPPPPAGRHAQRNDRILRLIEKGLTHAEVGRGLGLSARTIGLVVSSHPHVIHLLRVRRVRPATVAKRYRLALPTALRLARPAEHVRSSKRTE